MDRTPRRCYQLRAVPSRACVIVRASGKGYAVGVDTIDRVRVRALRVAVNDGQRRGGGVGSLPFDGDPVSY